MGRLSISQAWDETRGVLARDGKLIGTVALALLVLPGMILNAAVPKADATAMMRGSPWVAVVLLVGLISLIGQLAIIRLAAGPHVSVGEAIAHGARRLIPYFSSALLWVLPIVILGSILEQGTQAGVGVAAIALLALTLVGIFLAVRLILTSAVCSLENVGPIAILRRSWTLSRGHWWKLFGFLLALIIGAVIVLTATVALGGVLSKLLFGGDLSPLSLGGLVMSALTQLVTALIALVFFVMMARIYTQLAGASDAQVSVPSSGI